MWIKAMLTVLLKRTLMSEARVLNQNMTITFSIACSYLRE